MKIKKMPLAVVSLTLCLVLTAAPAQANTVEQWVDYVIGYSSQYSTLSGQAWRALHAPENAGANYWTPHNLDGTLEYLTLGYNTPVYASGATIVEWASYHFIYQVDLVDQGDALHTAWAGDPPENTGYSSGNIYFSLSWPTTDYLVKGLKIYVDTKNNGAWEKINAVKLVGTEPSPVPAPSSLLLLSSGVAGLLAWGRRLRI